VSRASLTRTSTSLRFLLPNRTTAKAHEEHSSCALVSCESTGFFGDLESASPRSIRPAGLGLIRYSLRDTPRTRSVLANPDPRFARTQRTSWGQFPPAAWVGFIAQATADASGSSI